MAALARDRRSIAVGCPQAAGADSGDSGREQGEGHSDEPGQPPGSQRGWNAPREADGKGNRASRIANLWNADLTRRIRKDKTEFRVLSFNKIRKTAGNMIRDLSDGEVAGVFLCHGEPVRTDTLIDIYTNRPFAKVFKAIRLARERLQPVFEFRAEWPEERKKGGLNISAGKGRADPTTAREGMRVEEIAQQVGVHRMTVYRHIKNCSAPRQDEDGSPALG